MKLNTAKLMGIGLLAASGLGAQAATIIVASPGNAGTFASASTLVFYDFGSTAAASLAQGFITSLGGTVPALLTPNANLNNSSTTAAKTFFDDFVFTIGTGMNLSLGTILSGTLTGTFTGFTESLFWTPTPPSSYTSVGTNPLALASLVTPTTATSWNNLSAGTYTLQYSGTLAKATTVPLLGTTVPTVGAYGSIVNLTPVPEAETYAMLLAGLGLIGAAVKRRNAKKA